MKVQCIEKDPSCRILKCRVCGKECMIFAKHSLKGLGRSFVKRHGSYGHGMGKGQPTPSRASRKLAFVRSKKRLKAGRPVIAKEKSA